MFKRKFFILAFLLFLSMFAGAQQPRFFKDIQNFKKQDSIKFPPSNAILFVGSSSFTKWKDVQTYFPKYTIINRGFGGSRLPDVIRYTDDIITPYKPKQVVIYCGENDFAVKGGVEPGVVVGRVDTLIHLIRERLPDAYISYISIKPSPSRAALWPGMLEANNKIEKMLAEMPQTSFINVSKGMFNANGSIKNEIFIKDNLHMNADGYAIWQKIMEPYLKK